MSSNGSNTDISSVDASKIAIYQVSHPSNVVGKAFTVYENDDCSGASYSGNSLDAMNYEIFNPEGADTSLVLTVDYSQSFNVKAGNIKSVRIPSKFVVDFYD